MDAVSVSAYIIFLSEHTATLDLQDLHGLALVGCLVSHL